MFYLLPMSFKKFAIAGALGCAAAFANMPAQAACLTSNAQNNCVTYDTTGGTTQAILTYTDVNLFQNNNWQITASTATVANFSNWEYGSNGTTWNSFNPGFVTSGAFQAGTIFNTLSTPSAPAGNPFYIRVTLSNTATLNAPYQFLVRTNKNSYTNSNGLLDDDASNNFSSNTRTFSRVDDPATAATPGPLPLMGAAAAFGYSRKIRKAIRTAG
jgi:hypothetical protein